MSNHRVHFRKENITLHVEEGGNLRRACLDNGVDPYPLLGGLMSCRGKGFCGTCAVFVDEPEHLSPATKREARYLKKRGKDVDDGYRLSCQAEVCGALTVTTDPDFKPAWQKHTYYSGRSAHSWEKPA
jgi:ferredoxin